VLKKAAAGKSNKSDKPVAIVYYDEKPGIQAIATTAPGAGRIGSIEKLEELDEFPSIPANRLSVRWRLYS
jgi:hypothetical protein